MKNLSEKEIERVKTLLAETDLAFPFIAERMGVSRATIAAINKRFQIRQYAGKRCSFSLNAGSCGEYLEAS